jgi:hypothetical protein
MRLENILSPAGADQIFTGENLLQPPIHLAQIENRFDQIL